MRPPLRSTRLEAAAPRLGRLAVLAVLVLAVLALGGAAATRAQVSPLGGQFQVNTYTTSHQYQPAVATDSAGNFVIVWTSAGSSGGDTSNLSVQARRWAADGAALGGEFQVNTYTTSTQR
ncbi:MAG: hypothetical protein ABIV06_13680, partial [Thermoanaerobaculia bacterium]